ncbi:hypothetical protein ACW69C_16490 [Streptomyces sp. MN3]
MNRRTAFLTMLAVTTVLTLTACGTEDTDAPAKGSDKASVAAHPSPSTPAAEGGRPVIDLPSHVTHAFDWGTTGDSLKDAVLADTAQRIKAVDLAIAEQDPLHEAYRFYSEGTAARGERAVHSGVRRP